MPKRSFLAFAVLFAGLSAGGHALAETPLGEQEILACAPMYEQCTETCRANNPENSAARAGCISRCAADRAVCEAREGYEDVKPWFQEKFQSLGDFFEGFREGPGPDSPPRRNYPPEQPERLLPENSEAESSGGREI